MFKSFGDVFRNPYSGALDLVSQAEAAFESWALSQVVQPNRKVNRCFPDGQVLEVLVSNSTLLFEFSNFKSPISNLEL